MTPEEIRDAWWDSDEENTCILAEIAAQLAEMNQNMVSLNDKLHDYLTIQIADELKEGKR